MHFGRAPKTDIKSNLINLSNWIASTNVDYSTLYSSLLYNIYCIYSTMSRQRGERLFFKKEKWGWEEKYKSFNHSHWSFTNFLLWRYFVRKQNKNESRFREWFSIKRWWHAINVYGAIVSGNLNYAVDLLMDVRHKEFDHNLTTTKKLADWMASLCCQCSSITTIINI